MCSMCPRLGYPEPPPGAHLPWAGDPKCDFVDWSEERTGWITGNTNDPSDICEERGEPVELGESVELSDDDKWWHYSDDASRWPVPTDDWAVDYVGELPEWLIKIEGFSVRTPDDEVDPFDLLAPEEALVGAT